MKFFEQIRFSHVLATLGVGMALLIAGAVMQNSSVQQIGLMIVFFGAIIYLMIRRKNLADKAECDAAPRGEDSP